MALVVTPKRILIIIQTARGNRETKNNMDNETNNDDNSANSNDNIRRSKRLAAKTDDVRNQLLDVVLADLERDTSTKKKNDSNFHKKKMYRNAPKSKMRNDDTGTLFDNGLQATAIIGATYVDDDTKGTTELCYLVKYENGQFELVLNSVAHKYCPKLIIDFLESRILFKEKDDFDLARELFNNNPTTSNTTTTTISQVMHNG